MIETGANPVKVRRDEYLVHDFPAEMSTEKFKQYQNKEIQPIFFTKIEKGSLTKELGIGMGPLKDLKTLFESSISTLLESFVISRLSCFLLAKFLVGHSADFRIFSSLKKFDLFHFLSCILRVMENQFTKEFFFILSGISAIKC